MKTKTYKNKKYQVWQGFMGDWFFTVLCDTVNFHGQHADSEQDAIAKAKERIDNKVEHAKWLL